jgi:hypothetical protein
MRMIMGLDENPACRLASDASRIRCAAAETAQVIPADRVTPRSAPQRSARLRSTQQPRAPSWAFISPAQASPTHTVPDSHLTQHGTVRSQLP